MPFLTGCNIELENPYWFETAPFLCFQKNKKAQRVSATNFRNCYQFCYQFSVRILLVFNTPPWFPLRWNAGTIFLRSKRILKRRSVGRSMNFCRESSNAFTNETGGTESWRISSLPVTADFHDFCARRRKHQSLSAAICMKIPLLSHAWKEERPRQKKRKRRIDAESAGGL